MSANLAIRLEMSGVSTACAWLAMQTNYDLSKKILNNSLMIKIA